MGTTIVIIEELTDVFYNIYKAAGLDFVNYILLCRLHEINICSAFMKEVTNNFILNGCIDLWIDKLPL